MVVLSGHSYSHSKLPFLLRRHNITANFLIFWLLQSFCLSFWDVFWELGEETEFYVCLFERGILFMVHCLLRFDQFQLSTMVTVGCRSFFDYVWELYLGIGITFTLQTEFCLNCRGSIESLPLISMTSVCRFPILKMISIFEQALSQIRELLITAKIRLPLLYPLGYLPRVHHYECKHNRWLGVLISSLPWKFVLHFLVL